MQNELYDALARVLLSGQKDEYGNIIQSPLARAIQTWANDEKNREKMVELVAKKINMDELIEAVAEKIKTDFAGWGKNHNKENLKEMVLKRAADKLADEKLVELKQADSPL